MSARTMILGVFRDPVAAQRCVDTLYDHGFSTQDINVLMSEHTRGQFVGKAVDQPTDSVGSRGLEGLGVGGAIGTAVGASIAAIAAIGTSLVIPGLNVVLAGPIAAALAGGGAGALTGGLIGGLAGLGIPAAKAEIYHTALREGGTVIGVTLDDEGVTQSDLVMQVMKSFSGEQIHSCRC